MYHKLMNKKVPTYAVAVHPAIRAYIFFDYKASTFFNTTDRKRAN